MHRALSVATSATREFLPCHIMDARRRSSRHRRWINFTNYRPLFSGPGLLSISLSLSLSLSFTLFLFRCPGENREPVTQLSVITRVAYARYILLQYPSSLRQLMDFQPYNRRRTLTSSASGPARHRTATGTPFRPPAATAVEPPPGRPGVDVLGARGK